MEKNIKKKAFTTGGLIIGSAIIWGAVIIGCSWTLKGTDCYSEIQNLLVGGTFAHLILIWGPMSALLLKQKKEAEAKQ